jgi:hypothetical protein
VDLEFEIPKFQNSKWGPVGQFSETTPGGPSLCTYQIDRAKKGPHTYLVRVPAESDADDRAEQGEATTTGLARKITRITKITFFS